MDTLEHDLADRLHRIGDELDLPDTTPQDDVRRGRRRLRRRHALTAGGSALAVAAVAGGIGVVGTGATGTAGENPQGDRQVSVGAAPRDAAGPGPRKEIADAVEEAAAERDSGVLPFSDVEVSAAVAELEGLYDNATWLSLALNAAESWQRSGATDCPADWTCAEVEVAGASRARTATDGATAQVVAEFPSGVAVITVSPQPEADPDAPFAGAVSPAEGGHGFTVRVPTE